MTFSAFGFKTLDFIGSLAGDAGTNVKMHGYVTADDAATIETSNYFDAIYDRVRDGDQLFVTLGMGGAVAKKDYVMTRVGGHVVITGENKTAGAGLQTLAFFANLADIAANGDLLTNYVPGYAFKIEKFDFRVLKPATTAAKLATINLEINTTDVTGGVIALTSANATPAGAAVAGTAITATNTGGKTDSFSIEASGVTAFVEGSGWFLVQLRNLET